MKKDLLSLEFSTEDLKKIDDALKVVEEVLKGKTRNLTPEERKQFGRIAEQNKLFVQKSKTLMEQYPEYVPPFVDKAEFDKDYSTREVIEKRLLRLESITEQLSDTKILLDNDNYTAALTFYRNIRYLSGENAPGTTSIAQELSQFFPRSKKKKAEDAKNTPSE
uniref:hypothetical protein n=1 Tax=Ornithobacterium rhinotracheale TaxID=28251 RepID=UPI0039A54CA2